MGAFVSLAGARSPDWGNVFRIKQQPCGLFHGQPRRGGHHAEA